MQLSKTQNSEFRINPENLHPCTWQQEIVRKIGVQRENLSSGCANINSADVIRFLESTCIISKLATSENSIL